jgi:hypothetical protein
MAAVDQDKTIWEFNQSISIPADQPRPEICYLPLPTRLTEVRVTCRQVEGANAHRARLFLDAGVCAIHESARETGYHLKVARLDVKQRRGAQAAGHIRRACALLQEYQNSRRL